MGNEDLGSSASGASRAPRSPRRWSSCTGRCCPLQEKRGQSWEGRPQLHPPEYPLPPANCQALLGEPRPRSSLPFLFYSQQAGLQRAEMKDKEGGHR